jgi:hypothetical protein
MMEAKILINLKSFCKVSDFTAFMSTFAKIFKCIWQMGTTQQAVQKQLVVIVEKLRHHDDSIGLWKYLNQ